MTGPTARISVLAPAKLNLMLAVGERRHDGYHDVATLMQTLDLADRIDVDLQLWDEPYSDVHVDAPGVEGGDTLVTRAIEELLASSGVHARVWVTIEKEIPVGGGLGGGSTDAAAALRAVARLLGELGAGTPATHEQLTRIAAGIGSDVPFFLSAPGAGFATGRGERVRVVDAPAPRAYLLVNPGTEQSTAAVYAAYERSADAPPLPATGHEARAQARPAAPRNDLAVAARSLCPELERLCSAIEDAGGVPLVCGSGATVAVRITSKSDRLAFEAVARQAVPAAWMRVAWTTAPDA